MTLPGVPGSSSSQAEMDSCVSYLRFPVSHSMAPLSRLLVYYVRENGEGVTDSLQIPIQPAFENQVCIVYVQPVGLLHMDGLICNTLYYPINTH